MKTARKTKATANKTKPSVGFPAAQAALLIKKIEQERAGATIYLSKAVKGYSTRQAIFDSAPEVHVAFVREVVARIAKLGKAKGKVPIVTAWFHDDRVPSGAEEVARQLMRRRLPFTDEMLTEMVEQIAGMEFVTFAPVLDPLVRELEKRSAAGEVAPRTRKALAQVADRLLVNHWSEEEKENWGMPRAADRKLAARLQALLV